MAREYSEEVTLRVTLNALEDDCPAALLSQFMVDYGIPARIIAGCSGIPTPTLYQHLGADGDGTRVTRFLEPKLNAILERLKTLAAEGKLNIAGSTSQRNAQLTSLLTIEEPAQ